MFLRTVLLLFFLWNRIQNSRANSDFSPKYFNADTTRVFEGKVWTLIAVSGQLSLEMNGELNNWFALYQNQLLVSALQIGNVGRSEVKINDLVGMFMS